MVFLSFLYKILNTNQFWLIKFPLADMKRFGSGCWSRWDVIKILLISFALRLSLFFTRVTLIVCFKTIFSSLIIIHIKIFRSAIPILSFALFFHFQFFTENGCNFALHKCPWNCWICQRTLITTGAIHFGTGTLWINKCNVVWIWSMCYQCFFHLIITCRLMLSRLHGKQNLWWFTDGHCTKCVSSRRSWHNVHFSVGFGAGVAPAVVLPAYPKEEGLVMFDLHKNIVYWLTSWWHKTFSRWRSIYTEIWCIADWNRNAWQIALCVLLLLLLLCFGWCYCRTWNMSWTRWPSSAWACVTQKEEALIR